MLRYILIEIGVLAFLIVFVTLMSQLAKRVLWPGEPLHPSFVGSLLSASGTIFAASIAWAIADHSIEFQKNIAATQAEERLKADRRQERALIESATDLASLLTNFLTKFPQDHPESYPDILKSAQVPASVLISNVERSSLVKEIQETLYDLDVLKQYAMGRFTGVDNVNERIVAGVAKLRTLHQRLADDVGARLKRLNG
jgi:Na+-transporting methylmalonyl-CoA/oxaloacetate decarboxylase gamma subunit